MSHLMLLLFACVPALSDKDLDGNSTDSPPPSDTDDSPGAGDSADTGDSPGLGDPALLCAVALDCTGSILDDPKAPCAMTIVDGGGVSVYSGPAAAELRGRSSLVFPKPQYSVELRDATEVPVWPGSGWRYDDSGVDQGSAWREPAFDDRAWATGNAPLGYGESYLNTTLQAAGITTYYRHQFTVDARADLISLEIGLVRNDGAVVYLNGVEVLRDNLPNNTTFETLALAPISQVDDILWVSVDTEASLLVDGINVIAVELHQADPASTDARFDLYLEGAGEDVDVNLFGMGEDADWILNGNYVDRSLIRNKLAFDMFQSMGGKERYAADGVLCELELNGAYQGVYSLGERVKRGDDRVDIAKDASFIIKLGDGAGFHANALGYGTWELEYPTDDPDAEASVSAYLTSWEAAALGANPTDPATGVFSYIDLDSAVDWVLLQELMKNVDGYYLSIHLWRDEGGKMFFTPWDLDLSMGYPYSDCGAGSWLYYRPALVSVMAADPAFQNALVTRWRSLREGPLATEAILAHIAGYDLTLGDAVDRNFERWPIADITFGTDTEANLLCPVGSYAEEHQRVLDFLAERLVWMDDFIETF